MDSIQQMRIIKRAWGLECWGFVKRALLPRFQVRQPRSVGSPTQKEIRLQRGWKSRESERKVFAVGSLASSSGETTRNGTQCPIGCEP